MKPLKPIAIFIITLSLFTNCSTAQKLQNTAPLTFGEVYCQSWVAGIEGGGSGTNLFIPVTNESSQNIQLDSVYFRGKAVKLERMQSEDILYAGYFSTKTNQPQDMILSNDTNEEQIDHAPEIRTKTPFELRESECVVSYKEGSETKYFKIENITQRQAESYPNIPPDKQ